ncbi:site-specific DNA-methyltransferase [Chitinophaga sp. YIM B06452]|uniref:DNA-methyltransferase n=1 Tax=Chitinophaga sp. YIM B06452 TaxID=3082158 RepID=UPI0031FE869A
MANRRTSTRQDKAAISAEIINTDTNKYLDILIQKGNKFQLILTSPPYNMGKEYESVEPINSYLQEIEKVIDKLVALLDDDGSICWQVGNYIDQKTKEIVPLDIFYYSIFKKHNLFLRNRIIWHFEHGLHSRNRFSGRYETILWFSKSDKYTFNLDNVRVPSKYPGKTYYKGDKKGEYSGNPLGKNPADVWKIVKQDWDNEVWEIPNVKANHKEKTYHPCQYPIELAERCILALSNIGDTVLDPYVGVGSTVIAAFKNGRNSVGLEKDKQYVKIAKERLKSLQKGELKIREIGTPIFVPTNKLAVAKKPAHFLY